MKLSTINGTDYGWTGGTYLGIGNEELAVFLRHNEDGGTDMHVWMAVPEEQQDSTDHNLFRQYSLPAEQVKIGTLTDWDPILTAVCACEPLFEQLSGMTISNMDRELKMVRKFVRII